MDAKNLNQTGRTSSTEDQDRPNPSIKKKRKPLENKKRMGPKKPKNAKSKEKQVISEKPIKSQSSKRKRSRINDVYDDVEAKFSVMERADKVLSSLADEVPIFLKCMLPSNVCYSFWLILPTIFCKLHLPSHDTTIFLVDEWGNEYKTTYLLNRHGLSAGWRGFSMSHRLLKGDILVFQLIEPCKLKVYIVRVNGLDVVDAALCLMNLDACAGTINSDVGKKDNRKHKRPKKYAECFLLDVPKPQENVLKVDNEIVSEQSGNDIDGFGSDVLGGSEISSNLQNNEVGCSGSLFLHEHPLEGVACR